MCRMGGHFQEEGGTCPEPEVCRDAARMLAAGGRGVEGRRQATGRHLRVSMDPQGGR